MEKKVHYLDYYFDNSKLMINKKMHIFLYYLIKSIFILGKKTSTQSKINKKIQAQIKEINKNLVVNESDYISTEYTIENLKNILKFVKTQNELYAGEILENILIIVFSYVFDSKKENSFGKYLYNNMGLIKDKKNNDFKDWFKTDKFKDKELRNIINLLNNDIYEEDKKNNNLNLAQERTILYNFLFEIYQEKYSNEKKYRLDKKSKNYINGMLVDESEYLVKNSNSNFGKVYEYMTQSQYSNINSCMLYKGPMGKDARPPITIMRSFFISVYIYYQNKHSPLMKYRTEDRDGNNNLAAIPFVYDLTGAAIEEKFAGIIMAPSRIEPRIHEIKMNQNMLKNNGLIELSKVLLFNKNIKNIDFCLSAIKTYHINYLNNGLGLFDNYTLEELDLSRNYLKEDCSKFLAKILSHLKGLKTINLSSNAFENGLSYFFVMLKKLYRQKKINLETLVLNNCSLSQIDFYELGELLKSKYCKLKALYLNVNNIPSTVNLIKKLKKNKSLTEICFNKSNLGNRDVDNLMGFMNLSNIEHLYLHHNKFTNFNSCLRLISRTQLITCEEEKKVKENKKLHIDSSLYNLDLSDNYSNKNVTKIELLDKIIDETNLYCLDLSHILYGPKASIERYMAKYKESKSSKEYEESETLKEDKESESLKEYEKAVENLKEKLNKDQKSYERTIVDINYNKVDKNKIDNIDGLREKFSKYDRQISEIIEDENSKYPIFLKEKARWLISEIINSDNTMNNIDNREFEKKLVNYMVWRRADENLKRLIKKKEKKKLIFI